MKRDWCKYVHRNRTQGDCQLVTAANAYYYLTGKTITKRRYERLIDLCGCRHGSATCIEKVHKELKIEPKKLYLSVFEFTFGKKILLPMELNVWHKYYGFHSVLIVDFERRVNAVRITNFKYATSDGWIFLDDLSHFADLNNDRKEPRWKMRRFGLAGSKRC